MPYRTLHSLLSSFTDLTSLYPSYCSPCSSHPDLLCVHQTGRKTPNQRLSHLLLLFFFFFLLLGTLFLQMATWPGPSTLPVLCSWVAPSLKPPPLCTLYSPSPLPLLLSSAYSLRSFPAWICLFITCLPRLEYKLQEAGTVVCYFLLCVSCLR